MGTFSANMATDEGRQYARRNFDRWLDTAKPGVYSVSITRDARKRTAQQNAKYWSFLGWIADAMPVGPDGYRVTAKQLHEFLKEHHVPPVSVWGQKFNRTTTELTTAQFSQLGDCARELAEGNGLIVPIEVWE